jgi:lactate dehydrogenase-like 2-hydroxyacid dehydrogenase
VSYALHNGCLAANFCQCPASECTQHCATLISRYFYEQGLARLNVKMIALRCAGFNNVALEMAEAFNISTARVPAYSPYAVAEHASALLMTLNRKTHKVYAVDDMCNSSMGCCTE